MEQEALKEDHYRCAVSPGESSYKERGSRFLGFALPARDEAAVQEHLAALRQKYHDGRHYCYAYRLQPYQPLLRINDDGEPRHSAGTPIFQALQAEELWNCLLVVVRYFGGTKLGVSGLVNAYKTAATRALAAAKIEIHYCYTYCELRFPYAQMHHAQAALRSSNAEIVDECMGSDAGYRLRIRPSQLNETLLIFEDYSFLDISFID